MDKIRSIFDVPEDWMISNLEDFLDRITYGFTCPMPTSSQGPLMITAKDLEGNKINFETARRTTREAYKNNLTDKSRPKQDDILLSKDGTLGRVAIVENEELCINQSVALLRPNKKILPKFLYYLLLTPNYQKQMDIDSDGTVIKHIYITRVNLMKIAVPQINEQNAIIKILTDLDQKIELNIQKNKNLEQMAQAIFKQWFIEFEFPNDEGKPYKSNGGEMIDSETGQIPKGWTREKIGNLDVTVTDFVANGSFASLKENVEILEDENYALFIRNVDLKNNFNTKRYVTKKAYDFLSKSRLKGGEVIISNVADVGSVFLCPLYDIPMTLGNNVIMITSFDKKLNFYFYYLFKSSFGQYLLRSITTGSAQMKFNKTDFRNLALLIPSNNSLELFNKIMSPIWFRNQNHIFENTSLSTIRDYLLPKLMSGKIRVPVEVN